ncbi:hypothetical protein [Actinoplanes sp. NPDC049118]|uniref:hypothetical protein n=1 Tax=Actinoplanes sp. NPDC049118 TaxID=3155769 RepID=UPI0033E78158
MPYPCHGSLSTSVAGELNAFSALLATLLSLPSIAPARAISRRAVSAPAYADGQASTIGRNERQKMMGFENAAKPNEYPQSTVRRLLIVGGAVAAVLAGAAAPASAAVPGHRVVVTTSGFDATDFKTAPDAACPTGKRLIGTGYTTSSGLGNEIAVDEVIPVGSPDAAPTSARVGAAESDVTADRSWNVSASAICSDPLPGLQRVLANSAFNSNHSKSATAQCPAGKQLTGTGYSINGSAGEIVIERVQPNNGPSAAPTAVSVHATESDPVAASWSVQAFAVCANPLPGLVQVAQQSSAFDSTQTKSATAKCPTGKILTGTGYLTIATSGVGGELTIDSVRPAGLGGSVEVRAVEEDPFGGNWRVDAVAICANQ